MWQKIFLSSVEKATTRDSFHPDLYQQIVFLHTDFAFGHLQHGFVVVLTGEADIVQMKQVPTSELLVHETLLYSEKIAIL